jgi:hypothetical protein
LIASSYDIASFLCLLPVSYLGGRGTGSKPLWIGKASFILMANTGTRYLSFGNWLKIRGQNGYFFSVIADFKMKHFLFE